MDWVLALIWLLPGMLVVLALSAVAELVAGAVGMGFKPVSVRNRNARPR
jgi:hypothetical protein